MVHKSNSDLIGSNQTQLTPKYQSKSIKNIFIYIIQYVIFLKLHTQINDPDIQMIMYIFEHLWNR